MATVMMAADLVRWFQLLCLDGISAKAQPKALRWGLFQAPGRLVRSARHPSSASWRLAQCRRSARRLRKLDPIV